MKIVQNNNLSEGLLSHEISEQTKTESSFLKFPCYFPLKIIGKNSPDFELSVKSILQEHIPLFSEVEIKLNLSKEGTYMGITAIFLASDKEQLDRIYQALSQDETISMVL